MAKRKMVPVVFANGYKTKLWDNVADIYIARGAAMTPADYEAAQEEARQRKIAAGESVADEAAATVNPTPNENGSEKESEDKQNQ